MPTFTLDENAHNILKRVRDKLKAAGQSADLSDAVRYLDTHQERDAYSGWADK